jgi:hypothetical protein
VKPNDQTNDSPNGVTDVLDVVEPWVLATLKELRRQAEDLATSFAARSMQERAKRPRSQRGELGIRIRFQPSTRSGAGTFTCESYQVRGRRRTRYLPKGRGDRYPRSVFRSAQPWERNLADCLSITELGEPQTHRNLSLFPLLADGIAEPGYLLLDEALGRGCARVTEVSEQGSVPELRFVNECDRPVLLIDGEELVGAKQNRILNLSVLVPAHKTIVVPVSCVEAGRWHAESAELGSAKRTHYAAGRARKASQVSASLSSTGTRRSDQSEVSADISAKSQRMRSHSAMEAAAALYDTHRVGLDEYLSAFTPVPAQLGALFTLNGRVLGLDLFDSHRTMSTLLPKLVESSALDAIDTGGTETGEGARDDARHFLDAVAKSDTERFEAIGLGEDLRLRDSQIAGGALLAHGRVVHLCAFRLNARESAEPGVSGSRIARASLRRRGRL